MTDDWIEKLRRRPPETWKGWKALDMWHQGVPSYAELGRRLKLSGEYARQLIRMAQRYETHRNTPGWLSVPAMNLLLRLDREHDVSSLEALAANYRISDMRRMHRCGIVMLNEFVVCLRDHGLHFQGHDGQELKR